MGNSFHFSLFSSPTIVYEKAYHCTLLHWK